MVLVIAEDTVRPAVQEVQRRKRDAMGGFDYYATALTSHSRANEIHGMRKRGTGRVVIKDILPVRDGCIMKAPERVIV